MSKQTISGGLKAVITGATSGIGLYTLKRLVNSGSFDHIIGLGRNIQKCQSVEFEKQNCNVEFVECDLTKIQSIKEFSKSVVERVPHIDCLINVAGIMDAPSQYVDGVEIQFTTNHLGHFLLTKLLLPHFAVDSRIINVSSGMYKNCTNVPTWESVHKQTPDMDPRSCYSQSKLANCLFTVALDNYLKMNKDKFPNIKTFAVRPGFIRGTELGRHLNSFLRIIAYPLIYMVSKDLDFGTDTIVYLTFAPIEEIESGKLYYDKKIENYTELVNDLNAKSLWELSEKLLESLDTAETS